MLRSARPSVGLRFARALGVLTLVPELDRLEAAPAAPVVESLPPQRPWERMLAVLDQVTAPVDSATVTAPVAHGAPGEDTLLVLRLAALCQDLGAGVGAEMGPAHVPTAHARALASASAAEALLARLTNELDVPRKVLPLVQHLPDVAALYAQRERVAPGAVRRLALRVPLSQLAHLSAAAERVDAAARGAPEAAPAADWFAEEARRDGVWEGPPQPMLKGRHLLALGLKAGVHLGPILEEAFDLQLDGRLTSESAAIEWARAKVLVGGSLQEETALSHENGG
jgi:tRNA nucleotidyltransferase (CCA-adding enzyme)